ncbi:alpha/beta hydrolase [Antarcticirhabdus aurantiaca]|uniref:Alpha/beta hydrolase n=1 Tax=Antarcticirhabdus aurantiaca TaxID=2606717 RepID=A0ACD4NPM2_9HYPH|nr:alpha/beta hydrolase [Antarcticirhabdus aurantiaca]WAJ28915.1 alpha/beta hydrolase [Jeongeuplla avenae]
MAYRSKTLPAGLVAGLASISILGFVPAFAQDAEAPATQSPEASQMAQPTAEMTSVLDKLTELGAKPIGTLSVAETRAQPTPADAVMAVMKDKNIKPEAALDAVKTRDITIPGPAGAIPARVYTPEGEGPFPLIVYYHGGGWVIADIDTYDASARALAAETGAVVLSSHYRQAPENKFSAAHEDAYAAYEWAVENSGELNADATRLAVAGESAGANLAANVAIRARDNKATQPDAQLLVYPIAGNDMETASYKENAEAMPLSKQAMMWFVEQVFDTKDQTSDPQVNLVGRDDLEGLPPATVINAQIDPLRSEGEAYAEHLREAGVDVEQRTFEGVAHEFFGMGAVVPEAKEAVTLASDRLKSAFEAAGTSSETTSATGGAPAARPATPTPAPPTQN